MATKKALEQEALSTEIKFVYDGDEYTIPPAKQWPLTVLRAQESGRMLGAVEALLGAKQMAFFEKRHSTMGELEDLLDLAFEAVEVDPKD